MEKHSSVLLLDDARLMLDNPSLLLRRLDFEEHPIRTAACAYLLRPCAAPQPGSAAENASNRHRAFVAARYHRGEQDPVDQVRQLARAVTHQNARSVATIERLAAAAEMRDEETGGHIARTGIYAGMIARGLGLPETYAQTIALAATVHDLGKIGIRDAILSKPGRLSGGEYEIMKSHTVIGKQILSGSSCPLLQMAASIALSHHERWDGSGYPYRLAGEQIPLAGRIVMLADQYDALRSRRVYKRPLDHATTCAILSQGDAVTRPEHFEPLILKTFLKMERQFAQVCEEQERRELTAPRPTTAALTAGIPLCEERQGSVVTVTASGNC